MTPRERLLKAFRAARKVVIGSTLFVGTDEEVERRIKRALSRGETVKENGITRWVEEHQVHDKTKTGSAAYTWKGDKVRVERFMVTRLPSGTLSRARIGFAWRPFE